jgi:ribonuclease G
MTKDLIVSSTPQETKVALLDDGIVSEIFIEREAHRGIVGNLYKGKVTRVLPGMQSAFVDIGQERDAFLYVADVIDELDETLLTPEEAGQAPPAAAAPPSGEPPVEGGPPAGNGQAPATAPAAPVAAAGNNHRSAAIEEMLEAGQEVLVQVVKEPLGQKGARITSHVSLPGRYLVFMPTVEHVGVSRKITDDDERRRLKTILKDLRQQRGGGGLIARTVGAGRSREDFERDMQYLSRTWDEVRAQSSRQGAPALLHRGLSLVQRLLRDILSDDIANIRLDGEKEFQRTLDMVNVLQPELAPRVRLYNGSAAILEEFGVAGELERALRSKVWLESGGYIVINQTEALVAIDINTGRFTGKKTLEDTIVKTNVEAVKEIVRQIRLRDLGGIIVVDFIDMEERKSRQKVMGALEQELKKDRSPSKVISVNEFGLVILTRKRVRQSLERTLCEPCPYCSGSGMVKSVTTVCSEIYDEVRKLAPHFSGNAVSLRVNPDVARALRGDESTVLKELCALLGHEVTVQGDPLLHQEQFDVVPK